MRFESYSTAYLKNNINTKQILSEFNNSFAERYLIFKYFNEKKIFHQEINLKIKQLARVTKKVEC